MASNRQNTGSAGNRTNGASRVRRLSADGAFPQAPKVQDVALVTSQSDDAVSDFVTWRLVGLWRKKGLVRFASVDFPEVMKIEHDMIDPAQKNQQTDIVYPVLVNSGTRPERYC